MNEHFLSYGTYHNGSVKKKDIGLPFLDIKTSVHPDGSFGHTVYRKPAYTYKYLYATSHYHPVTDSLTRRVYYILDTVHMDDDLKHLQTVIELNRYVEKTIKHPTLIRK